MIELLTVVYLCSQPIAIVEEMAGTQYLHFMASEEIYAIEHQHNEVEIITAEVKTETCA